MSSIKTTCAYCGVGCGIEAKVVDAATRKIEVTGDVLHPANFGRLCSKGSALAETVSEEGRLLYPEIGGVRASWDHALDHVAAGYRRIREQYGPESVALYVSGQLLTEDYYAANKFTKAVLGTANIDTNSRLCMSSAVAAYKRAFGEDLVPCSYEDLESAELIVLTGSNTAWCHPIVFQRIKAEKEKRPALKVVVIDPRRTATCEIADLHLPITPGRDTVLFNALLAALYNRNAISPGFIGDHTEGFAEALLAAQQQAGDTEWVARECGLEREALERFIDLFISTEQVVTLYSQGVNQSAHGTDKGNAIINCHLASGRIGRPGMGPFSITGQPNAMGGREVGGLANMLAAHMDIENEEHRALVREFWQVPQIAQKPGLKAVDLFEAIHDGRVKAVWIMATNPVVSLPDADRVREALSRCELVVVSDCIADTDTARLAHVKLPAQGWGEKDGTVTNSERRISRQRALMAAPGEARPDWWAIARVAERLGYAEQFAWKNAAGIFREHAALSGFRNEGDTARFFDVSALATVSDAEYDALQPVQWPVSAVAPHGTPRLFADGRFATTNRKARFVAVTSAAPAESVSNEYPLWLNTGRIRDQWHTMTRTGLTSRLLRHISEPFCEIHPQDAQALAVANGALVEVSSRWGLMRARAVVTPDQQAGSVFVPMHWTGVLSRSGRVGAVVNPRVDPVSGQPESKHTPVRVKAAELPWQAFVMSTKSLSLPDSAYAVAIREDAGFRYELGADSAPVDVDALVSAWLQEGETLEYRDASRAVFRVAVVRGGVLESLVMAGPADSLPSRQWLLSLLGRPLDAAGRRSLLSGKPADPGADVGRIVCACFAVGEKTIRRAIREKNLDSVAGVGHCLKAGTNCGSCQSEIAVILADEMSKVAAEV